MQKQNTLPDFPPHEEARMPPSLDCAGKWSLLKAVKARYPVFLRVSCILPLAVLVFLCFPSSAIGAGVTVITHGYNGNVTEWVIPMGDKIPQYHSFPGSNSTSYQISITKSGSTYSVTQTNLHGVNPLSSDSGEIVIALNWSSIAGLFGPSTTAIAANAALALLSTNLIPELAGRPLAEMPLHLVGHSRGASVMAELARILGAQGIWVDQVTTLDPYPLGLNGDPAMVNYANVLFADNYWQNMTFPSGQALTGAYNRYLTSLDGGNGSAHSDTHLWYHGTIDLNTPTWDTLAGITNAERAAWWTATEAAGTNAAFLYSLIGGGDRLSGLEPAGAGNGRIIDGFNKVWDLGAGVAANPATNRTKLPANNGAWPNLIGLTLTSPNPAPIGDPIPLAFYYQSGANTSAVANVRFYLDSDSNPHSGNEITIFDGTVPNTGISNVYYATLNLSPNPATTLPGTYSVFGSINSGTHTRYLYAPQRLVLGPSRQPPVLVAAGVQGNQFGFNVSGFPGQTVIFQVSTNLVQWASIQTNTLAGTSLAFADPDGASYPQRYYRVLLVQ